MSYRPKADFDSAQVAIERKVLYSKVWKFYEKADNVRKSFNGNAPENVEVVYQAYAELINMLHDNNTPTEYIEWYFNDGHLRSSEEIAEYEDMLKKQEYRQTKFERDRLYNKIKSEYRANVLICLIRIVPTMVSLILFAFVCNSYYCDGHVDDYVELGMVCLPFMIIFIPVCIAYYYISMTSAIAIDFVAAKKEMKMCSKAGVRYIPSEHLISTAATLVITTLAMSKGKKR